MPGPHDDPPHDKHGPPEDPHGPPHEHPPHEHPPHGPPHDPHDHHHSPGGEPPGAHWIENDERRRSLGTIGRILQEVGKELQEDGETSLRDSEIVPPDECTFTSRYERNPEGHMQLLFEIRWDPRSGPTRSGTSDDPFGDKLED